MQSEPVGEPTDAEGIAQAYVAAADGSLWIALMLAVTDGLVMHRETAERLVTLQRQVSRGYVRGTISAPDASRIAQ